MLAGWWSRRDSWVLEFIGIGATHFLGFGGRFIGSGGHDLHQRRMHAAAVALRVTARAVACGTRQYPTAAAAPAHCSGCGFGASGACTIGFGSTSRRTQRWTQHLQRFASLRAVTAVAAPAAVARPRVTASADNATPAIGLGIGIGS